VTTSVGFDPNTATPILSRTAEYEPTTPSDADEHQWIIIDELLEVSNNALGAEGMKIWVLFDRLDVAFEESKDLEKNALRALFRVYNDMRAYGNLSLKIFVRDDIWNRITESGFAEASHITRKVTIEWNRADLLNLTARRIISNKHITDALGLDPDKTMSDFQMQTQTFYSLFPDQIDSGSKTPKTFDWMLGRTKDGTGANTPRELIHFLNELRNEQIRRLERGEPPPPDSQLFDRAIFKPALKPVSEARLRQTLLAEYPEFRQFIMALHGEKTSQTPQTLATIWNRPEADARELANQLTGVGFFESLGSKEHPQYRVPFIYRDCLEMVQGSAEN
jgi:hypothetical protein